MKSDLPSFPAIPKPFFAKIASIKCIYFYINYSIVGEKGKIAISAYVAPWYAFCDHNLM